MSSPQLLVTICLQNDFVKPIGRLDALPNLLHIGYWESLRLNGPSFEMSPLQQLIDWSYSQPDEALKVLHVRDWHSENDEKQLMHLKQFGSHCLAGSKGAEFIFQEPANAVKNIEVVNSTTLNDFVDADLAEKLAPFQGQKIRVGLVGVWTEAKVSFLCYELNSRYPEFDLAVCSALTASSSRAQHFNSLEQLRRILGVKVYDSVGAFIDFLNGAPAKLKTVELMGSESLEVTTNQVLQDTEQKLIRYLFRGSKNVTLNVLTGGFSGNRVMMAKSIDRFGYEQAPTVIKLGPREAMAKERVAFEKVESIIGNAAPRIEEFVDYEDRGAIKYLYASMAGDATETFQKLVAGETDLNELKRILKHVFNYQLGKFYRAAQLEVFDLLEYYGFDSKWADAVSKNVKSISRFEVSSGVIKTNWGAFKDPSLFYAEDLPKFAGRVTQSVSSSFVHGDLNGANILLDGNSNVWLIDFFHSHRGHVLKDLIKLENDILFIMTPIQDESELETAVEISRVLVELEDLSQLPDFSHLAGKLNARWLRSLELIRYLRSFYKDILGMNRVSTQYQIAALRYAVHTLSFDEPQELQKNWALLHAALLSENLAYKLENNLRLRVDWLESEKLKDARVGLTILPGRKDQSRKLNEDLLTLKQNGISHIVCLVTEKELEDYGVKNYTDEVKRQGFTFYHLPILDQGVTNKNELSHLIRWIDQAVGEKAGVAIHCVGGLGRSGTVAACWLRSHGLSAAEAIRQVRQSRSSMAIENSRQEKFVFEF